MKTQYKNNITNLARFMTTLALGVLIIGATTAYAPTPQPDMDGIVNDVLSNQGKAPQAQAPVAQPAQAPAATQQVVIPLSQAAPRAAQPASQAPATVAATPAPRRVVATPAATAAAPSASSSSTTTASVSRSGEVRPDQGQEMVAARAGMPAHRWLNAFNVMVVIALVLLAILNYWLWSSARKLSDAASEQLLTAKQALEDVQTVATAGDKPEKIEKPAKAKKAAGMKMESGKENAA